MLRTSNTATIPKYVGMPCRKSPSSNRPVKITTPKATKAARANALWKALDHGTEITNNTAPTPRKRSVPKESGANVCQAYPARKTIPSAGRNPSSCDLIRYPRDRFHIVRAARERFLPYCSKHNRHSRTSGNPQRGRISSHSTISDLPDYLSRDPLLLFFGVLSSNPLRSRQNIACTHDSREWAKPVRSAALTAGLCAI